MDVPVDAYDLPKEGNAEALTLHFQMTETITSGKGNPEKRFPSVHPCGTDTPSSYSAGSHLTRALLDAPSDGFLLSESMKGQQSISVIGILAG